MKLTQLPFIIILFYTNKTTFLLKLMTQKKSFFWINFNDLIHEKNVIDL